VIFRIMLEETQKAPSTMALRKTNAAQIASALSFIVTSTRRSSVTVAREKFYQKTTPLRSEWYAAMPRNWCTAPLGSLCQRHEICRHFRFGEKVPGATKNIYPLARPNMTIMRQARAQKAAAE
jgi:hypothetical protein